MQRLEGDEPRLLLPPWLAASHRLGCIAAAVLGLRSGQRHRAVGQVPLRDGPAMAYSLSTMAYEGRVCEPWHGLPAPRGSASCPAAPPSCRPGLPPSCPRGHAVEVTAPRSPRRVHGAEFIAPFTTQACRRDSRDRDARDRAACRRDVRLVAVCGKETQHCTARTQTHAQTGSTRADGRAFRHSTRALVRRP